MAFGFGGKIVLITGGGSGIGRATAVAFASAGAKIVLTDSDEQAGMETLALIGRENAGRFVRTNVAQLEDMEGAVQFVLEHHGRLDIAFNNAGVQQVAGPLADVDPKEWDRVLSVNLTGVYNSMRAEIPVMLAQGGGIIVNNASTSGIRGFASMGVYSACKHAVVGLTKSTALEYAKAGIRINAVLPGPVDTAAAQRLIADTPGLGKMIEDMIPIGRSAQPEQVADAVMFLSSDQSAYILGHSLVVDGGMTIK